MKNENRMMLVQLTPIRKCNLRCDHCFITNEHKLIKTTMSERLFEESLNFSYRLASKIDLTEVESVIMGGEIHLLGSDKMLRMIKMMINKNYEHKKDFPQRDVSTTVITNLVGMNKEKLDSLVEANKYHEKINGEGSKGGFIIGTSYEPDTGRFRNEKDLNEWKENIHYLNSNGCLVATGVTGTNGTVEMGASEIYRLLTDELGTAPQYDHLTLYGEGANHPELMPSYENLARFLTDFFSLNIEKYNGFDGLFDYREPFSFQNLNSRWDVALAVNYDGSISMDSESSADDQFSRIQKDYLKIGKKDEDELLLECLSQIKSRQKKLNRDAFQPKCLSCKHISYCKGGFIHYKDTFNKDDQCSGIKPFLDELDRKYWNND